ncbi:MAG: helix-turn-helix domain-containing protein [Myxococcota bacterium]
MTAERRTLVLNGLAVREARQKLGLSRQTFSESNNLSVATLKRAEGGLAIHADTAKALAEALGTPLKQLIEERTQHPRVVSAQRFVEGASTQHPEQTTQGERRPILEPLSLYIDLDTLDTDDIADVIKTLSEFYGERLEVMRTKPLPPGTQLFTKKVRRAV